MLALVPKAHTDMVAAVFRTIAQPDPEAMALTWDSVHDQLPARWPRTSPHMDAAKTEVLAFNTFPRAHWRKIWSTNPLARLNKEIKRQARVVAIFPNEASVIRLIGMILTDTNDEWITDERRYLSEGSMALLDPDRDNEPIAAITGGDAYAPRNPRTPTTSRGSIGLWFHIYSSLSVSSLDGCGGDGFDGSSQCTGNDFPEFAVARLLIFGNSAPRWASSRVFTATDVVGRASAALADQGGAVTGSRQQPLRNPCDSVG